MQNTEQSIEETGGVPVVEVEMEVSGMTQTAVDKTLSIADMAADAKATGDAIDQVAGDVADLAADVADIEQWTGEDIPLNTEDDAPTIAEALLTFLRTSIRSDRCMLLPQTHFLPLFQRPGHGKRLPCH